MITVLDAIGESLPLAVAIAFSPLAIVAVVIMLMSEYPRGSSISFVLGWAAGIALVVAAGFSIAGFVESSDGDLAVSLITPLSLIALGIACIALAARQWRRRPGADADVALPGWMARIDGLTAVRAGIFGSVLAATKPKNLILALSAGVSLAAAGFVTRDVLIVGGVFIGASSASIAAPVVAYLIVGKRIRSRLDRLKLWMVRNNSAMLGVILLFVGVFLIGNALTRL